MTEMKRNIVKVSVQSNEQLNRLLDLATEKVECKRIVVSSPSNNVMDIRPGGVPRKVIAFLENEGFSISHKVAYRRRGKKEMAGLVVDVNPLNRTSYKSGVLISCVAEGVDDAALKEDTANKEMKLVEYFTKNGIPADRVCHESVVGCEYKFY